MKHLTIGISVLLVTACAHDRTRAEHDTTAGNATTDARSQAATPAPTPNAAVQIKNADGTVTNVAVNSNLLKQGFRTRVVRGELFYCRTEPVTGTAFKSNVCRTETQILDAQNHARDTLNRPGLSGCLRPGCN